MSFAATLVIGSGEEMQMSECLIHHNLWWILADSYIHIVNRKSSGAKVHERGIHQGTEQTTDWRMGLKEQEQRSGREQSYSIGMPEFPGVTRLFRGSVSGPSL